MTRLCNVCPLASWASISRSFLFSEPDTLTVLTNNLEAYHSHLIQHLAKLEGTLTLCSGTQQITVQAFLLRNSSQFLKKILARPCSCSCTDTCIILPHTPSPALDIFVKLLHGKIINRVSTETFKTVTSIGKSLGVRNIIKTASDVIEKADDEDCFNELDQNISDKGSASTINVNTVVEFSKQRVTLEFPKSRLQRLSLRVPFKL